MLKICDYCGRKLHFWNQSYLIHPDGDEKTKLCCSSCERKIFDPLSLPSEEAAMMDETWERLKHSHDVSQVQASSIMRMQEGAEKRGCHFHPDRDGHVVVVSIDGDAWAKFVLCRECGLGFVEQLVKTYEEGGL